VKAFLRNHVDALNITINFYVFTVASVAEGEPGFRFFPVLKKT